MFGFGKKNSEIDAFGDSLVADLTARFPPDKEERLGSKKVKPARSLGKAAGELIDRRFASFVAEQELGVYGKARLLNRIKWQMREGGYTDEFIDVTLAELARAGARGAPRASKTTK